MLPGAVTTTTMEAPRVLTVQTMGMMMATESRGQPTLFDFSSGTGSHCCSHPKPAEVIRWSPLGQNLMRHTHARRSTPTTPHPRGPRTALKIGE